MEPSEQQAHYQAGAAAGYEAGFNAGYAQCLKNVHSHISLLQPLKISHGQLLSGPVKSTTATTSSPDESMSFDLYGAQYDQRAGQIFDQTAEHEFSVTAEQTLSKATARCLPKTVNQTLDRVNQTLDRMNLTTDRMDQIIDRVDQTTDGMDQTLDKMNQTMDRNAADGLTTTKDETWMNLTTSDFFDEDISQQSLGTTHLPQSVNGSESASALLSDQTPQQSFREHNNHQQFDIDPPRRSPWRRLGSNDVPRATTAQLEYYRKWSVIAQMTGQVRFHAWVQLTPEALAFMTDRDREFFAIIAAKLPSYSPQTKYKHISRFVDEHIFYVRWMQYGRTSLTGLIDPDNPRSVPVLFTEPQLFGTKHTWWLKKMLLQLMHGLDYLAHDTHGESDEKCQGILRWFGVDEASTAHRTAPGESQYFVLARYLVVAKIKALTYSLIDKRLIQRDGAGKWQWSPATNIIYDPNWEYLKGQRRSWLEAGDVKTYAEAPEPGHLLSSTTPQSGGSARDTQTEDTQTEDTLAIEE